MTKKNTYRIFHKFDAEAYKINFYINTDLDLVSMNTLLLALQTIHSNLPHSLISDDTIQAEHIARYWSKFRAKDGGTELTHDAIDNNAIDIDLHRNWSHKQPDQESTLKALIEQMKSDCVGQLFLEVESDTFSGKVPNSPYTNQPDDCKAAAINLLLTTRKVDGLEDMFGRPAYVTFLPAA